MSLKAVLFDLDDTLYDHQYGSRAALGVLHERYNCFQSIPFDEFERQHGELLEHYHAWLLRGEFSLDEVRFARFRDLFARHEGSTEAADILAAVRLYSETYYHSERVVLGARALLDRLRADGLKIGLVTNNTVEEQMGKLKRCELAQHFDVLAISEAEGIAKPDARIFSLALERLGCTADEAIMVGDSWAADVEGAQAAGLRAIWLNRYGRVCPNPALAFEIQTLDAALEWLIECVSSV
jgi:putative hydrolase of the HAD superfamily